LNALYPLVAVNQSEFKLAPPTIQVYLLRCPIKLSLLYSSAAFRVSSLTLMELKRVNNMAL